MNAMALLPAALAAATPAAAACVCLCQEGRSQPVCDDIADAPPVCPPRACTVEQPLAGPAPEGRIRPLGRASCALTRVYDGASGDFQWIRLCK